MVSHISKYGHRFKPESKPISSFNSTYGGDFVIPFQVVTERCKICGRKETRKIHLWWQLLKYL